MPEKMKERIWNCNPENCSLMSPDGYISIGGNYVKLDCIEYSIFESNGNVKMLVMIHSSPYIEICLNVQEFFEAIGYGGRKTVKTNLVLRDKGRLNRMASDYAEACKEE